jgi:hypothetical protein
MPYKKYNETNMFTNKQYFKKYLHWLTTGNKNG